jgi:hypothetical protein
MVGTIELTAAGAGVPSGPLKSALSSTKSFQD